ncbi:hypothetical protein [Actibacterium sp. MT2.3-13A]|uniref:hypothetical protein n=1 Tax=Actibacterium sp. MT2.3-13A TaxID=2828332 RepID=UPI001BABCF06|nr:hypothetical protein [Actibacterium sp. MT2.3-13A]
MPKLVRLYIRQCLIGFSLSGLFVAALLSANVANLWHLISTSNLGIVACMMLFVFNGIVFSGVQFGIAVMRMAEDDDSSGGRRRPEPVLVRAHAHGHALVPVPVRDERRMHR